MHIIQGLVIGLLQISYSIATSSADNRFRDLYSEAILSAPLKLDDSSYHKVTAAPRDYSAAVLLTAVDPRFACLLCRNFQPEWDLLSKSWTKGDKTGESRLIFGTLDFSEGRNVFQAVRIPKQQQCFIFITESTLAWSSNCPSTSTFSSDSRSACSLGWISTKI